MKSFFTAKDFKELSQKDFVFYNLPELATEMANAKLEREGEIVYTDEYMGLLINKKKIEAVVEGSPGASAKGAKERR